MEEPDWGLWIRFDAWTLREAILLLEGKCPKKLEPPYSDFFYETQEIAIRSNRAGGLSSIDGAPLLQSTEIISMPTDDESGSYPDRIMARYTATRKEYCREKEVISHAAEVTGVRPGIFLKWAFEKKLRIDPSFIAFLNISMDNDVNHCISTEVLIESDALNDLKELTRLKKLECEIPGMLKAATAAAFYAGIWATVRKVSKQDLYEGIHKARLPAQQGSTINQIWDALPPEVQTQGRIPKVDKPEVASLIWGCSPRQEGHQDLEEDAPTEKGER